MSIEIPATAGGESMLPGTPLREFEALHTEHDYILDTEFGELPAELRGTLYRNGMGRWESGGSPMGHIFDGDGMLAMFTIDGGEVRFRNRYVRTNHYQRGNRSRGPAGRGTGTMRGNGGILANALRWPLSNQANTNVVWHAGKLLALWEGGRPHAIDPETLATDGIHDFNGELKGFGSFSAHPKIDPRTGELFNFGTTFFPAPGIVAYRVDPTGKLHKLASWRTPTPRFNHDVGLTSKYLAFAISPMAISPIGMLPVFAGARPLSSAIGFRPDLGTEIVLVPRDGGRRIHAFTEAQLHFHIGNCYDDGDDTVLELVRYNTDFDTLWNYFHTGYRYLSDRPILGGPLTRLRVTKSGRVLREDLTDGFSELPQIDPRATGRRNRYSYTVDVVHAGQSDLNSASGSLSHAGITTLDHDRGVESTYEVPNYGSVSEAAFAPRSESAPEGDGWLLSVEYDRDEHRSRLIVLDAQAPERGPVYAGKLRHHLPFGLHGTFVPRHAD
ncbi:carotenoid oxygenase family protein [Aldersonia sp. NBC_00410]|uniref:carotenoid oxygenase family protein n=1 Tax=Aldersonia sp. NBC_00410 TaxID=2975954 RepID=UPI00224ECD76|nr:carotenoid oxygenase family protein [Aldersonia sp. NBC_00410]MCX5042395.1 carotenoid oxygenase family protein [Aldersonia sp. NBC_00410]